MSRAKKDALVDALDKHAIKLLKRIGQEIPNADPEKPAERMLNAKEEVAIFNASVHYLAVREKVVPDDASSGMDELRDEFRTATQRKRGRRETPINLRRGREIPIRDLDDGGQPDPAAPAQPDPDPVNGKPAF